MPTKRVAVAAGLMPLWAALPLASEYCVTCSGPDRHYACTYDGAAADPGDARLKLYCITEMAKMGQHATCTVDRQQKSPCPGDLRKLAMPDGYDLSPPAAAPVDATKPATSNPGAQQGKAAGNETEVPKTDAPPKTVQEMVEKGSASTSKALEPATDAAKSTGSAIGKAGKAVGDAAKKTWTCISSLFGDC
jgi:hypothetical protein